jgi:hypothetical protein
VSSVSPRRDKTFDSLRVSFFVSVKKSSRARAFSRKPFPTITFCDGVILLSVSLCVVSVVKLRFLSKVGRKCRNLSKRSKNFLYFFLLLSTAICLLLRLYFYLALSRCYYALRVYFVYSCVSLYRYLYIIYIYLSSGAFVCARRRTRRRRRRR